MFCNNVLASARKSTYSGNPVLFAMNSKHMELVIRPAHGNLQDVVKISDCGRAAPTGGAKSWGTQQQNFQLIYGGFEGLGHDVVITPYMYEAIVP